MVGIVGFWDQQAQDLLTSVRELGGWPAPLEGGGSLEPYPTPSAPPISGELTRGALDGVHGTGEYPMPVVQPPGELGPYGYHESAPGVWLPDDDASPSGETSPSSSGRAGTEVAAAEQSLRRSGELREAAESMLTRNLSQAHAAAAESQARMRQLHQEIQTGCEALRPRLGQQAGKEQMAQLLDSKASEVKQTVDQAQQTSSGLAANLLALGEQFGAARP